MSEENYIVNEGKNEIIEVDGVKYQRLAIRTHVITDQDDVCDVIEKYAKPHARPDDIVFMTEKAVACTQRRAIPMKDIHPRPLARFLCKFVLKTPYGIGLGIPETMEMALQECGTPKILFAAAVSAVGKLFHKRGWFYKIAGYKARSIDGPCDYTLPPYNEYVVLGPAEPDETAKKMSQRLGGIKGAITDINDLEGQILGISHSSMDRDLLVKIGWQRYWGTTRWASRWSRPQSASSAKPKADPTKETCMQKGEAEASPFFIIPCRPAPKSACALPAARRRCAPHPDSARSPAPPGRGGWCRGKQASLPAGPAPRSF